MTDWNDTNNARPLAPISGAAVCRLLEANTDLVFLYCGCSNEPRALVNRTTVPVWQCTACGCHLFHRTER